MHGTLSVAPAALEGANALTDTERLVELEPGRSPRHAGRSGTGRIGSVEVVAAVLILVVVLRGPISGALSAPALQTWMTVFASILTQSVPFLVFGVVLSAVIAVFGPASFCPGASARRCPSRAHWFAAASRRPPPSPSCSPRPRSTQ